MPFYSIIESWFYHTKVCFFKKVLAWSQSDAIEKQESNTPSVWREPGSDSLTGTCAEETERHRSHFISPLSCLPPACDSHKINIVSAPLLLKSWKKAKGMPNGWCHDISVDLIPEKLKQLTFFCLFIDFVLCEIIFSESSFIPEYQTGILKNLVKTYVSFIENGEMESSPDLYPIFPALWNLEWRAWQAQNNTWSHSLEINQLCQKNLQKE